MFHNECKLTSLGKRKKKHDKLSINFEAIVLVPAEELNMGNTTAAPFG